GSDRTGDCQHYYVIDDRLWWLTYVCERCAVSDDHCTSSEQRFSEQLTTKKKQRDAVSGQEIKRIRMTGHRSVGDADSGSDRKDGNCHARYWQIDALVVIAPRCPNEKQARRDDDTQPAVEHVVHLNAIHEHEVERRDHRKRADRQLEKAHAC